HGRAPAALPRLSRHPVAPRVPGPGRGADHARGQGGGRLFVQPVVQRGWNENRSRRQEAEPRGPRHGACRAGFLSRAARGRSMTLDEALACNDRGIAKAKELGIQVSLVVVDELGQLVQLDRMDGAALMSPDIAEAKAVTALNFKRPTSEI